jgi:hypothetical protein
MEERKWEIRKDTCFSRTECHGLLTAIIFKFIYPLIIILLRVILLSAILLGVFLLRRDTRHNDIQPNDTQHCNKNATLNVIAISIMMNKMRHSARWHLTQSVVMLSVANKPLILSVVMLNVVMLSVVASEFKGNEIRELFIWPIVAVVKL